MALDPADGAPTSQLAMQAPYPVVTGVDAGFLFWIEFGGVDYAFRCMPLPAGSPQTVFVEPDRGLVAPVLTGDDVYWFGSQGGKLQRVPKTGGPAELIYHGAGSDVVRFARLAIAGGYAYVFDSNHTLYRVSLKTRTRETLVEDVDIYAFQADDEAAYFVLIRKGVYRIRH